MNRRTDGARNFPRRPPRLDYLFSSVRPFYFVTFNTYNRLALLARDEIHRAFREFCEDAQDRGIAVGRYVLVPDHVHVFVAMPGHDLSLPEWMRILKTGLGKELLRLGTQKPHWQEGFFDHVLRSSESYGRKWDYVRMNPVRAGLCRTAEEWPYQGEIVCIPF